MPKPIPNIKTPCRFCGVIIWAPKDCREPECDECEELHNATLDYLFGVEVTLEPITEASRFAEYFDRADNGKL